MHDQHGCLPVLHEVHGRPLLVQRARRLERAAELPIHEPQLFRTSRHAHRVEHAVVVDQAGEARGVAGDPIHHVAAVRRARRAHLRRVDIRQSRHHVQPLHHVLVGVVAPVLRDGIGEVLPIARRAMEVHGRHDVAARREHLIVPARAPGIGPRALRATVDQIDDVVLLGRIEGRRLEGPPEHRVALGAHKAVFVERPQVELGERRVVDVTQLARRGRRGARGPHLVRRRAALV